MLKGLPSATPKVIAKFWARVNQADGEACWLWLGGTARGYGQTNAGRLNGKQINVYAHRFSWVLANGPIPDGLQVLHRCDVPRCVNPAHLFLGTQQDNLTDARRKGRLVDGSGAQRLSEAAYRAILLTQERGIDLARRFHVSETTIARIRMGIQGRRMAQRVLQHQPRQPEARLSGGDIRHTSADFALPVGRALTARKVRG